MKEPSVKPEYFNLRDRWTLGHSTILPDVIGDTSRFKYNNIDFIIL